MKHTAYYLLLACLALYTSCSEKVDVSPDDQIRPAQQSEETGDVPYGWFVATFASADTRAQSPTIGSDARVQHIRYLLFDASGNFVKERALWLPSQGSPTWPFNGTIRDTLPNGTYRAVFLGNVEKTLFPYKSTYYDVLTGYQTGYANGRIWLPRSDFSATTEYYFGQTTVSNTNKSPTVYLQRIIGAASLHRDFIDSQAALNTLANNIIVSLNGINLTQVVNGQLRTGLLSAVGKISLVDLVLIALLNTLGGVTGIVDKIVGPITNLVVARLLSDLATQLGTTLTGNANQTGMLADLGVILNPWALGDARTAIVTINDFPRAIDFDLKITDKYPGLQRFAYDFPETSDYLQKNVYIRGFGQGVAKQWDIRRIDVIKRGIVSGLVIDDITDDLLLRGSIVDINDPIGIAAAPNIRYKDNYSFLSLYVDNKTTQSSTTLKISLSQIGNLKDALDLGLLTDIVFGLIGNVQVSIPIVLPLVNINNLELSGEWKTPTTYQ